MKKIDESRGTTLRRAAVGLGLGLCLGQAMAQSVGESCSRDLEALPGFILENDAGGRDLLALRGEAALAAALQTARAAAAQAQDEKACMASLGSYLRSWRKGHLWVENQVKTDSADEPGAVGAASAVSLEPDLRLLSPRTALLTLRSFAPAQREALQRLLIGQRKALQQRPNWIIDLRYNEGGSDTSFMPLLPWVVSGEMAVVGVEWLATPANIRAQEQVCARYAPGDKDCIEQTGKLVARLRQVAPGSFAQLDEAATAYSSVPAQPGPRPQRVAVLMDKDCASSCEQLLLTLRQSFAVKLLGRPSYGALDYSNVRPLDLPSGQRQLWYATSRSRRLPAMPVDAIGVLPDIALPAPADAAAAEAEVQQVQRWLEGGSLQPAAAKR